MPYRYPLLILAAGLFMAACAIPGKGTTGNVAGQPIEERAVELMDLPDRGAAPELVNDVWLNTPEALRLADLRGQVVLLEFWTFG